MENKTIALGVKKINQPGFARWKCVSLYSLRESPAQPDRGQPSKMANHRNVILAGKSKGTTPALLSFMALQHFISIEEYSLANGGEIVYIQNNRN